MGEDGLSHARASLVGYNGCEVFAKRKRTDKVFNSGPTGIGCSCV